MAVALPLLRMVHVQTALIAFADWGTTEDTVLRQDGPVADCPQHITQGKR